MLKRRRSQRVHPDVLIQDAYVKRRYEDLSVCIHRDIKNGRGQYNYYAPWLDLKLQSFPTFYREKHSVSERNIPMEVESSHKLTPKFSVTKPRSMFVSGSDHMNGVPRNAWIQEDKDNNLGTESKSMSIPDPVNEARGSEALHVATPTLVTEDRGNFLVRIGANEIKNIEPEEQQGTCSTVGVKKHNHVSLNSQEQSQPNRASFPDEVSREDIRKVNSAQPSLPVAQSGISVSSRLCTIL